MYYLVLIIFIGNSHQKILGGNNNKETSRDFLHKELSWQKYHKTHARIPFIEAFTLKAI